MFPKILATLLLLASPAFAAGTGPSNLQIKGSKDGISRDVKVYMPAGYNPASGEKLPVLYYFHGYGMGTEEARAMEIPVLTEMLTSTGLMKPFIVVAPDLGTGFGLDSPQAKGEKQESFIVEDLIPQIEKKFPADPDARIAMGNSMGGYIALNLSAKHPGTFQSVVARQPMLFEKPKWMSPSEVESDVKQMRKWRNVARKGMRQLSELLPSETSFHQNNPIETLAALPAEKQPRLFVDVGDRDDFKFYEGVSALQKSLKSGQSKAVFHVRPGDDHDWQINAKGLLSAFIHLRDEKTQGAELTEFGKFLVSLDEQGKLYPTMSHLVEGRFVEGFQILAKELKERGLKLSPGDLALLKRLARHPNLQAPPEAKAMLDALEAVEFDLPQVRIQLRPTHCALESLSQIDCKKDRVLVPIPMDAGTRSAMLKAIGDSEKIQGKEAQRRALSGLPSECDQEVAPQLKKLTEDITTLQQAIEANILKRGAKMNPYLLELEPEVRFDVDYGKSANGTDTITANNIVGATVKVNGDWPANEVAISSLQSDGRRGRIEVRKWMFSMGFDF